jgi:hypothetical protein
MASCSSWASRSARAVWPNIWRGGGSPSQDWADVTRQMDRVSLSHHDKFNINQDGSIDFYVQHKSPGKDKESNWLPSPFELFMRLYWPDEKPPSILDGSSEPPPVERASQ